MADIKISELPQVSTLAPTDILPSVASSVTSKITVQDLANTLGGNRIVTGSVTASVDVNQTSFNVVSSSVSLLTFYNNGALNHGSSSTASGSWSHAEGLNLYYDINYNYAVTTSLVNYFEYDEFADNVLTASISSFIVSGDYSGNTFPFSCSYFRIHNPNENSISLENTTYYSLPIITNITYNGGTDKTTFTFSPVLQNVYYEVTDYGGINQSTGQGSHTEGIGAKTFGVGSHAEGAGTQAVGVASHAEGINTIASGSNSHAEGNNTQAVGKGSHAEGGAARTGIDTAYYATSIVAGLVILSASYGNVVADYAPGDSLVVYDLFNSNGSYNKDVYSIGTVIYNAPSTEIQLVNTTVNATSAYVGNLDSVPSWNGNQTIPGNFSHAEGQGTRAIGDHSHAEGYQTFAVGDHSHAEGNSTQAIGGQSHAEGSSTQAIGLHSHAEGQFVEAIGEASHAEGNHTQAAGFYSHAEGSYTFAADFAHTEGNGSIAGFFGYDSTDIVNGVIKLNASYGNVTASIYQFNGTDIIFQDRSWDGTYGIRLFEYSSISFDGTNTVITLTNTTVNTAHVRIATQTNSGIPFIPADSNAHAEGFYTVAAGAYGHAEGSSTIAFDTAHAEGNGTQALGLGSHAEGSNTKAIGELSHAEGDNTIASGSYSHAEGYLTIAIGEGSHAEGQLAQAIGSYSHAEGEETQAIGQNSHAEGFATIASGAFSHAEGYETEAIGDSSHAEGLGTVASGSYQHVQGQYNISSSAQSAFIIGNGTSNATRSNLVFTSGSSFQITGSLLITGSLVLPTAAPTSLVTGSFYFNFTTNKLYAYNGTTWVTASLGA